MNPESGGRPWLHWLVRLRRVWFTLTEPSSAITDPETRFRSRLLAQTLLIAIIITALSSIVSLVSSIVFGQQTAVQLVLGIVAIAEMVIVYIVSQRRNFESAILLVAIVITSQIVVGSLLLAQSGSERILYFLAVVILFAALFMPLKRVAAIAVFHLIILAASPFVIPELTIDDVVRGPANFYLVVVGLILLSTYVRNRIEQMRSTQIIRSEHIQRNLLNSMSDVVSSITPDGRLLSINVAGAAVLERSQAELQEQPYETFVHPDDRPILEMLINQLLSGEKPPASQLRILRPHDEILWVETSASATYDEGGKVESITFVSRDISDRKHAEARTLRQALERERRDTAVSIVHAISHDFRNRLATIETSRYLLERALGSTTDPKMLSRLETIQKEVTHLTQQIENLRMVETLVQPQTTECDLDVIMIRIIEEFSPRAEAKGIILSYSADYADSGDLPQIAADPEELIRAMRQLVLNALAHTPSNGVITLRATSREDGTVCAEVSDNGEGIAPEHLPHIFEPFYRPDRARTTDRGGVGLGLSIVRMIVEAYGGKVSVESTPGRGSRFTLCFRALRRPPSLPEVDSAN